ncbi:hypothetical protein L596_028404 [Steinernema carpocapsae]|uniref:Major facilitator superfamily (MFS) profile domain-containing protein n=1 Tax=Steinernema carpocapsae TaxID=34508 RepID=A0A4U5LYD1_STECR|nr:hypothetical protein L596_028404 [Steinernema carpocapsae]
MYVTDKYGIKVSCLFATLFNFVGASIRFLSTTSFIPFGYQSSSSTRPNHRLPLAILFSRSSSESCRILVPGKPADDRQCARFYCEPYRRRHRKSDALHRLHFQRGRYIVSSSNHERHHNFHRRGRAPLEFPDPKRPPSDSSVRFHGEPLKPPVFRRSSYAVQEQGIYVQMITSNFGFAILYSLFFAGEEMFTKLGYPDINGFGLALASLVGCVAALLAGFAADRTKKFNEIVKFCYLGSALTALGINMFLRFQHRSNLNLGFLYVFIAVLSFFCTPTWPVGLELGVEATYPVAEATSSGVLITCGMLALFVISYAMKD